MGRRAEGVVDGFEAVEVRVERLCLTTQQHTAPRLAKEHDHRRHDDPEDDDLHVEDPAPIQMLGNEP